MNARIEKRELLKEKALMSYAQILVLMLGSFAFSYMIYESSGEKISVENKELGILGKILNIVFNQISKPVFPLATATSLVCCNKNKQDSWCNDYLDSECSGQCSSACLPTRCEDSIDCRLGCCFNSAEGLCMESTSKARCEMEFGGIWKNYPDCNTNQMPECRKGCCVLGSRTDFVTSERCKKLSGDSGRQIDFRAGITNEAECLALSMAQERGACKFDDNSCKTLVNSECRALTGRNAVQGKLCTAEFLNTTCRKTQDTICIEGKDEVYFKDSCGNAANVYDSSKVNDADYWTNIKTKENSCNANSANANSASCGNCNYFLGSKCKNIRGENICADTSCKQAKDNVGKKDRKNGESWCVYDGKIGEGDDIPGSRHYRYSCIDGEVKIEPCADFRNEICVQRDIQDVNGTSVEFSTGDCRINAWQECIDMNSEGKDINNCANALDCFVKDINIADKFNIKACLPKYPEGFELRGESESGKQICGIASMKCTIVYQSKGGKCVAVANKECESAVFTEKMNDFCRGLGDCGLEVNVAGKLGRGYQVTGAPAVGNTGKLIAMSNPVQGNKADIGNISKYLGMAGLLGLNAEIPKGAVGRSITPAMIGGGVIGAGGFALWFFTKGPSAVFWPSFGNAMIGFGVGMLAGGIIAKMLGIDDPLISTSMAFFGGLAGIALTGWLIKPWTGAWCFATGQWGWCLAIFIGSIIIMIILGLFGSKKCKNKVVEFKCEQWQAPLGGDDCGKCNNPDKLCSKYKCESLGQACQFMNEGSKDEMCISARDDGIAPRISPWLEIISGNFSYTNITGNGFMIKKGNGNCIEAYTPLLFGIKTDKASQCKYSLTSKANFEAHENFFGESSSFLFNHSMLFSVPSADWILHCANDSNITYQDVMNQISNVRLYTRCQDSFGNFNPTDYLIDICSKPGEDSTAPLISYAIPSNGAFIANDETEKNVSFYTNEPSSCRWSRQDKDYELMENSFSCENVCNPALYGWQCNAVFNNLTKGENKIYARCKDQPWFAGTGNESRRNKNMASYLYVLKVSENPLSITSVKPNGTIKFGSSDIKVNLEIGTSGGAENGKSQCFYWNWRFGGGWISFYETFSNMHRQRNVFVDEGSSSIPIKCEDIAGNSAESQADFNAEIDYSAPVITRIYSSNSELYVLTDENSECSYSNQNCNFIFGNGTRMSGGFSQEHSTAWNNDKSYYVKCRDEWNNEPASCSIKIRAYN